MRVLGGRGTAVPTGTELSAARSGSGGRSRGKSCRLSRRFSSSRQCEDPPSWRGSAGHACRAAEALTTSPKRQPRERGRLVQAEALGGGGGARGAALLAQHYGSKSFERTGAVQKTSSFHSCSRKTFCVFGAIIIKEEKSKARTWRIIGL